MDYRTIGSAAYEWAGRTYSEVNGIGGEDGSIAIIPVGSLEQHGHHLPVATDTILVEAVAHLTGERTEDIPLLTLPTVWCGYSPHHVDFGGTATARFTNLQRYIVDIAESAIECGFDAILLLNGHGGNTSLVQAATSVIGAEHPSIELLSVTYFQLAASFVDEIRESDPGGMGHGGEFETSLMLHVRPDLVREDAIHSTYREEPYDHAGREMFIGGPLSVYRPFSEYTEDGELGDPSLATKEKGRELFERLGDEMEHIIRQVHSETS